jgi:small subunit ribosomal protein S4
MIGDRKIDIPSYTVTVEEENSVHFTPESKIPEMLEKSKKEEPKVETIAEGEEGTETQASDKTESTETVKKDKPSAD